MITIKKAPAGIIAQLHTDDLRRKNAVTGVPVSRAYLGVTGQWSETEEEALRTLEVDRLKEVKKAQKKIEKLKDNMRALESHINDLNGASSEIMRDQ